MVVEQDTTTDVTRLLNEAAVHLRAGRPGEAQASAREVLDAEPEHPGALHMLGVLAARAGRAQAAVDLLQRAIAPEVCFCRPEEGLMFLFPSYFYHRTVPFESEQPRVSISFDILRDD